MFWNKKGKVIIYFMKENGVKTPEYETPGSSGLDVRAFIKEDKQIYAHECELIPTGIRLDIPMAYEAQIRPRSGLASKFGIGIINSPSTIDADYRGEIKIPVFNFSSKTFIAKPGMRIAQIVFAPVARVRMVEALELTETERGASGFGSTGLGI